MGCERVGQGEEVGQEVWAVRRVGQEGFVRCRELVRESKLSRCELVRTIWTVVRVGQGEEVG